jgi:hypothetical protein
MARLGASRVVDFAQPGFCLGTIAQRDVSGPIAAPVFTARFRTVPGNVVRGLVSNALAPGKALGQPFRSGAAGLCEVASWPAASG